ncbi:MAG: hypothetical protein IJ243_02520 [Prevotella sp.]|nr:hypothetical protein [Prevotella sp.]
MEALKRNAERSAKKIVGYLQKVATLTDIYDAVMKGQHQVMELVRMWETHHDEDGWEKIPEPCEVEQMFEYIAELLHMLDAFDDLASHRRYLEHLRYRLDEEKADYIVIVRRKESR